MARVNRNRRVRRRRESRFALNSIRRHLFMMSAEEITNELHVNTPGTLPRSKKIDKTSTAIELETSDPFQTILSAEFDEFQTNQPKMGTENVFVESPNCALIREINRLEAIEMAVLTLETGCELEISEALDSLEWKMAQMISETEMIDKAIEDFEEEKLKRQRKWDQIERILTIIKDDEK